MGKNRLPPGLHSYDEIVSACRRGEYRFAVARAASGRLNYMPGITPEMLGRLRGAARESGVGFLLLGSRVSGPRLRQRSLHPVLEACLPLSNLRRAPSALFPGAEGIKIDKTRIKELSPEDPRTSDLSVILVSSRLSHEEMDCLAVRLEAEFGSWGWSFPVRVFSRVAGRRHQSEEDFIRTGKAYLRSLLPPGLEFSERELREALGELYCALNLPRKSLTWRDLGNGLATAALFSASFSLGLGFHPVLPAVGFLFGCLGRYLARMRAAVAFSLGDTFFANSAALAFDAALGAALMALVINPAAGLGLSLGRIALASALHTLSKGSLRLFLDKRFSSGHERRQAAGVLATSVLNFLQGAVTSFVYSGSALALGIQASFCALGLWLLFGPPRPAPGDQEGVSI